MTSTARKKTGKRINVYLGFVHWDAVKRHCENVSAYLQGLIEKDLAKKDLKLRDHLEARADYQKTLKRLVLLVACLSPAVASAHDGGEGVQCFVQVPEVDCSAHPERCTFVANETTQEWRDCHDNYWLCVDALRSIQVSYEQCVGAEWQLAKLLKRKPLQPNATIMFYPYPQHPIEGLKANNLPWCRQELQACHDTAGPWLGELAICERQRASREKSLRRKL